MNSWLCILPQNRPGNCFWPDGTFCIMYILVPGPPLTPKLSRIRVPLEFNFLSFHALRASVPRRCACVHSELPVVSSPSPGMGVLQILQDALCQIQYWVKKWEIWEWNVEQQNLQSPHLWEKKQHISNSERVKTPLPAYDIWQNAHWIGRFYERAKPALVNGSHSVSSFLCHLAHGGV